jgi:hypothetical protein
MARSGFLDASKMPEARPSFCLQEAGINAGLPSLLTQYQ